MSLDKSIEHKKEHRKPYRKAKSIDPTCRNHGTCHWCKQNRLHASKLKENQAKMQEEEYKEEEDGSRQEGED